MKHELLETQKRLNRLRKSNRIPHWKLSYADFLLQRMRDFIAIERVSEAKTLKTNLDKWFLKNEDHRSQKKTLLNPKINFWTESYLEKLIVELKHTLESKKTLIPAPERKVLLSRIEKVEGYLSESKFLQAREELLSLRLSLISRLKRSYRARKFSFNPAKSEKKQNQNIGLYNTQHTLENTFALIGERDPIWIEDFLEVYHNLFKYVERLKVK
ncbi:MAG: hypothetical protein GX116_02720 [Fibrobacter sp.]|nr:hypothetical protein [Fibrobacter sp.]